MNPDISIIIPVLNEQAAINPAIAELLEQPFNGRFEVIVVDGSSEGTSIRCIRHRSIKILTADKGRGSQMNRGAQEAAGEILLFLHCDTRLPRGGLDAVKTAMADACIDAGAFDLKIDARRAAFRLVEFSASLRSRLTRVPFGDQAIFVRRSVFFDIGGFQCIPLMEDVDLMQRIKRKGKKIRILKMAVLTSARRWQKEGVFYTTLRNWYIMIRYLSGVAPEKIARLYPDH